MQIFGPIFGHIFATRRDSVHAVLLGHKIKCTVLPGQQKINKKSRTNEFEMSSGYIVLTFSLGFPLVFLGFLVRHRSGMNLRLTPELLSKTHVKFDQGLDFFFLWEIYENLRKN